jgi:hypothetical protein
VQGLAPHFALAVQCAKPSGSPLTQTLGFTISPFVVGSHPTVDKALVHVEEMHINRRVLLVCLFLITSNSWTSALAREMPVVDPNEMVTKYGKPDRAISTEWDKPRPPFVTRALEYKKAKVRIVFLANAPMGSPPPYNSWKLMGYQDLGSNAVLQVAEAEQRLLPRKKK